MKVHVHENLFSSKGNNFEILKHHEETFFLTDFLSRKSIETYQDPQSFKGMYIRPKGQELLYYIFQNDYYYKTQSNEMPTGFPNYKLLNNAKTKRVIFHEPIKHDLTNYEFATIKYIKYSYEDEIYYAKDKKKSWKLEFMDIDQETILAKYRYDLNMHVCLQNVLMIEKVFFCFFKTVGVF